MNDPMIQALRGPILVLGGGGFVGANLFLSLQRERSDVFAVVRQRPVWRLDGVLPDRILEVDITDPAAVRNMIEAVKPQTVFDCVAYGGYSFEEDARLIHRTNFTALVDLIEILAEHPFTAYIHAGSSSEYGLNCSGPDEDAPLRPNGHYAVSKAAMAQHIHYCGVIRGLPIVNLRLYSVYGPLEDTSRLMPNLIFKALRNQYPPFVNPETSRDFVYISDACAAFIQAAVRMQPEMYGTSYNIGTGIPTTIKELASTVKTIFEVSGEPSFQSMPPRKWDLISWYANPLKAKREFGWSAKISLTEGLGLIRSWVASLSDNDFVERTKLVTSVRKRSVSAIIACYKDVQAIPVMHQRLTDVFRSIGCDYEIIFVNDCSPDDSANVIKELSAKDPQVLGISHSRNFGSQMAFRSGMELSSKDSVVLLDGDLQDTPELILAFYKEWEQGHEVVYGRRIKREMPFVWGLIYKAFYRVFAKLSYIRIPHDAGDFSLIDRRVVGWLLACPERDLFLRGLRAYVGFRQIGVDYIRPERMFGRSTNNLIKNIGWAKKAFFSYSTAPLHALTAAGFALLGTSLLLGAITIAIRLFFPHWPAQGATSILLATLFFGSLNLVGIGILGEYIGKIMEEVKGRPRLIRSSLIRNGELSELLPDESVRR
jgi:nucleoside-diphosphate-sugar epimerase/glycosyltransferase involved in cell wall biosynthesis